MLDDLETASDLLQTTVADLTRVVGPAHPYTCDARNNLGRCLIRRTMYTEAEEFLLRSMEINLSVGDNGVHKSLVTILLLAEAYIGKRCFDEAERYIAQGIAAIQQDRRGFDDVLMSDLLRARMSILEGRLKSE